MYTSLIKPDDNEALRALEWVNSQLSLANKQYKEAMLNKLDERTVRYFSDKIDFYKDCRTSITEEVYSIYAKDSMVIDRNVEIMRDKLWSVFKKRYPECKYNFDDVFKYGVCVYKPFMNDFASNRTKPVAGFSEVNNAYVAYSVVKLEKDQLDSFYNLYNAIHTQVGEYGSEPFTAKKLPEDIVVVPSWAINEISDKIVKNFPKAKKTMLKYTMDVQKLRNKLSKDPEDKDVKKELNKALDTLENYTSLIELYEGMAYSVDNPHKRLISATRRGQFGGFVNRGYEIFSELYLGVPKKIKKMPIKRDTLTCHIQEIDDLVDCGKYCLDTAEACMAMYAKAGKITEYELYNYEFTKKLVKQMRHNQAENDLQVQDFTRDLTLPLDKEEVKEAKRSVIKQIEDVNEGYKTARFNTPFGYVAYNNGKLVNLYTKEVYPVSKLDEYVYDGKGLIFKVDANNAILEVQKYDDIEKQVTMQQKLVKQQGTDKKN